MEKDCTGVFGKRTFDEQMNDNSNSSTTLKKRQDFEDCYQASNQGKGGLNTWNILG